jgi:hypothetical protein
MLSTTGQIGKTLIKVMVGFTRTLFGRSALRFSGCSSHERLNINEEECRWQGKNAKE